MNKPTALLERADDYLDTAPDFEHFPANGKEEMLDMQQINQLIRDMRDHISNMGEWQTMDSAPKDGTWFLGCNFNSPMAWAPYEFVSWAKDWSGKEYSCQEDTSEETECTHWQPLPFPPNLKTQSEAE